MSTWKVVDWYKNPSRYWEYDISAKLPNGKKKRVRKLYNKKKYTKTEVEEYAKARKNALEKDGIVNQEQKWTLADFWKKKEPQYRVSGNRNGKPVSKGTEMCRDQVWELDIKDRLGSIQLDAITQDVIDGFILDLSQNGKKPSTNRNVLNLLKSILRYAAHLGYMAKVPRIKVAGVKGKPNPFEPEEYEKQVEVAARTRLSDLLVILLGGDLGLRSKERMQVYPEHFREQENVLDIIGRKGDRDDYGMPLTPRLAEALKRACANAEPGKPLIKTVSGVKLTPATIGEMARRIQRIAGVRTLGSHALRHTFATDLIARNNQLPVVQKLMGHASIEMTLKYVKVKPEDMQRAIKTLRTEPQTQAVKSLESELQSANTKIRALEQMLAEALSRKAKRGPAARTAGEVNGVETGFKQTRLSEGKLAP